jgi:hypothetical protein
MKTFALLLCFGLCACKSTLQTTTNKTPCPSEGTCTAKIVSNSRLFVNEDVTGARYPTLVKGNKLVFQHHYTKERRKNVADDFYTETVYLEFNPKEKKMFLQDQALEKVGLLFGRFCYCKGSAGWFSVKKGTLKLSQLSKGTYRIQLDFSVAGMPQKVPQIDAIISTNKSKK